MRVSEYRGLLDVSALRDALAVLLVRHLHPLHRRHDEDSEEEDQDDDVAQSARARRKERSALVDSL